MVLIPGVNGRWEWMRPTIEALAGSFRVATFSLCGEPGAPPLPAEFDGYLAQVDAAIEALGAERVLLAGVSFGGWVALRYAAEQPARVGALVLASTPGPGYVLPPRYARWIAAPRRSMPIFVATAPRRTGPEIRSAFPAWRERLDFSIRHGWRALRAPMSGVRAAARISVGLAHDFAPDAARVSCPLLCVTGEDELDNTVPAASTREYLALVPGARAECLARTGHMGTVTRARDFAAIVDSFADAVDASRERSPRTSHANPGRPWPAAARGLEGA
jgi:pimeloyl-ACP methyl ester carboxylesterase